MIFGLTTRWNAGRHTSGAAMIEEILGLGFTHVELGYDLTLDLVAGVRGMVAAKAVTVDSCHAFCPLPLGAPLPHPELFTLASRDAIVRRNAVRYTTETIRFAAEVGARAVVVHAGNVEMPNLTGKLVGLFVQGKPFTPAYDRIKMDLLTQRDKRVAPQLDLLYAGIEALLPVLADCRVRLAFENLPSCESIPTEVEMEKLLKHFNSPWLGYWHDFGHGQIREDLGFGNHRRWVERLRPWLTGMHIHDLAAPDADHLMPSEGHLPFAAFREVAQADVVRILEPSPRTTRESIAKGLEFIRAVWADPAAAGSGN